MRFFKFEAMMGLAAHEFLQWDAQQAQTCWNWRMLMAGLCKFIH